MKRIADTGLLKAALDCDDDAHAWGAAELRAHAPFHTCEAVLDELAFLLGTGVPGLQLVVQGDLILDFDLGAEAQAVLGLLQKYQDRQMDLADACILRMTELEMRCKVWTVDRGDFRIYRRHGRQPVPCAFPPGQR
ncbi:hypothetical protein LBMAG56_22330 [Verrucomicrobiota bacterium]|nr:hypothetical protein LBMAG56_22330 [Verrucomicrobiota bacterium]